MPEQVWRNRHKGFLVFLLGHAVVLMILSFVTGHTAVVSLGVGAWITCFAVLGAVPRWSRKLRASWVSLGLVTSSALLVHLSGGYIEMHFHYFVMVTVLALYQDWFPFLLAIGYVLFQHGIGGLFFPQTVYNHPDAWVHPWKWAFIHATFLSSACIGVIIAWRANESGRARIENLLNSSTEGFLGLDLQGRIVFANRAVEELTGYSVSELTGRHIDSLFLGDPHPGASAFPQSLSAIRGALASPNESYVGEAKLHRRDGGRLMVECRTSPLRDRMELSGIVFTLTNITERKQAEESIRANEERFRSVAQSANDAIVSADGGGNIVNWNRGAQAIFGYREEEVLGKPLTLLMPERYREDHRKGLDRMRTTGEAHVIGKTVELHGLRKDGTEFPLELSLSTWKTGDDTFYSGIIRDATERRHLEEQLRQSQKMEAIGQLAGGVAHDFNNLLTVISGNSQLLLRRLPPDHPQRRTVEQISQAGKKAAALTHQLLAFSRKQVLQPTVLDLNAVVKDLVPLLRRLIGEHIQLRVTLPSGVGAVKADSGQLAQVIMNLAVNARDAMPKGGRLTLETANVPADRCQAIPVVAARPGEYVMLTVCDTGVGMDAATQARIFEPFFTTKEPDKGTGLGLSMVYGIVKQSDGFISVDSEPGRGTTFRIYLPQVREGLPESPSPHVAVETLQGSETVLLVEDEEMIRTFTSTELQSIGYTILEARNAQDAMRICREHPEPIHLLLTDVIMPGLSGRELAERVLPLRPTIKILYMSGYAGDDTLRHGMLDPGAAYLQKPFSLESLAQKIREVLANSA